MCLNLESCINPPEMIMTYSSHAPWRINEKDIVYLQISNKVTKIIVATRILMVLIKSREEIKYLKSCIKKPIRVKE